MMAKNDKVMAWLLAWHHFETFQPKPQTDGEDDLTGAKLACPFDRFSWTEVPDESAYFEAVHLLRSRARFQTKY